MQYWAYYISIFIMGLTLLIHLQLIAAPSDIGANRISFGYRFYSHRSKCSHEN